MTTSALRQSQQRAIARAQAAKLVRQVEPITADCWFVPSTSQRNRWHIVSRSRLAGSTIWTCTCKAGAVKLPCRHQAAAFLYEVKLSAAGGSIPSAPAAVLPGVARISWDETLPSASDIAAVWGRRAAA